MNVIIQLLLMSIIITFGAQTSGFADSVKNWIWKTFLFPRYPISAIPDRPFFCPLCLTWWCGVIYLLIIGQFTLEYLTALAIMAYLTDIIDSLLRLVKDILVKVLDMIYRWGDL